MRLSLRVLLLALLLIVTLQPVFGQAAITVSFGPPALPVYEQPICPDAGYLWTPGYWGYDPDDGYYWVPGTWVLAPEPGYLWTPDWWGWENGAFLFHRGYWATEVGFYGGINYGFGYFGVGFGGGRWDGGIFRYNTAVVNVNTTIIHNTYIDRTVIVNNTTVNRVSYNGGEGGITARPTPQEQRVEQAQHLAPVAAQTQHIDAARSNPQLRASANQGKPPIAATAKPGEFSGGGAVAAKEAGAPYKPAPARGGETSNAGNRTPENTNAGEHPATPTHASELQPHQPATPNSGDPKLDKKYQQQQAKLATQQNAEHQKLQQQQEKEDQKAAKASAPQKQQVEQKHQQQTQQLEQKHTQQQQQLQTRQAPRPSPRPR
jgi:WXXGXW repeat (2 copies)